MPEVVFFREADGRVPMLEWLRGLPAVTQDKCQERLELLRRQGHELRRPVADFLDSGIHELRVRHGHAQFRMLYFFHGREVVVVSHGFMKAGQKVPRTEIDRAIQKRWRYLSDPKGHRFAMGA